jgi:hypothetical protein
VAICATLSCGTGGGGGGAAGGTATGDANVHVTDETGDHTFNYDATRGVLQVTPPAAGAFTATFVNLDPRLSLEIHVDSNGVREGDRVQFPLSGGLTSDEVDVRVGFADGGYGTQNTGSSGEVFMDILAVTDDSVDFRATFSLTLAAASGGGTLRTDGFLEVHEGSVGNGGGIGDTDGGS